MKHDTPIEIQIQDYVNRTLNEDCDYLLNPVTLKMISTHILRTHFSNSRHYGVYREHLGCLQWDGSTDGEVRGALAINPTFSANDTLENTSPAIWINNTGVNFTSNAANNQGDHLGYNELRSAHAISWTAKTQLHVKVIHSSSDTATFLAESALLALLLLSSVVTGVTSVAPEMLSSPKKHATIPNAYEIVLVVNVTYNFVARITQESLRLKKYETIRVTEEVRL